MTTAKDTLREISRAVPAALISEKKLKGNAIHFISWYDACDLMDERAPGWSYEVARIGSEAGKVYVVARVTVPTDDGPVVREATGNEDDETSGYGDAFSNAESMALRRAFAKFGLARELYKGKGVQMRRDSITREGGHKLAAEDAPKPPKRTKPITDAQLVAAIGEPIDPLPLEEGEHWREAIEGVNDLDDLVALLPDIDAEANPYRRAGALRLWAQTLANDGDVPHVKDAGAAVKAWAADKPGRGEVLAILVPAYKALTEAVA